MINMKKIIKNIQKFLKSKMGKFSIGTVIVLVIGGLLYFGKAFFIAALVNGKPVSRISVIRELEKQSGKTTLDSLIEKDLILQEAKNNNVKVTDDQINKEIDNIKNLLTQQKTTLDAALASKGMTMNELREQIVIQKSVEAMLLSKIQISDAEVKDFFDKNLQYFKDNISKTVTLAEATAQIKDQIFQQKMSAEYATWIEGLKSKAKVLRFVNY